MSRKKEMIEETTEISLKDKINRTRKEIDEQKTREAQDNKIIEEKLVQPKTTEEISSEKKQKKVSGLKKAKLLAETVTGKRTEENPKMKEAMQQEIKYNAGMYNGQQVNYGQIPGMGMQQPINIIVQVPENKMPEKEPDKRQSITDAETRQIYEQWNEEENSSKNTGKTIARKLGGWIFNIGILVVLFFVIKFFLITIVPISGDSMSPTYNSKDQLLMEKVSYYLRDPEVDEIIYLKLDNGTNLIKRIVGVPGDTIQIIGGVLYRNDEPVETDFDSMVDTGIAANKIKLEYDEYFVLGDNRNDSNDSRNPVVGIIDRDQIKGRIIFKIWPLGNAKKSQSEDEAVGM